MSFTEQRMLQHGFFHSLSKLAQEGTQLPFESGLKSAHTIYGKDVLADEIPFAATQVDAINFATANPGILKYYNKFTMSPVPGTNNQTWVIIDGGNYMTPMISPVDILNSAGELSFGYDVKLFRADDSPIFPTVGAWNVDSFAGAVIFNPGQTPVDLGWGNIKITCFVYVGQTIGEVIDGIRSGITWQPPVLDNSILDPIGLTPDEGHRYIVPVGGEGAWIGQDNKIATWTDGAWLFTEPGEGWTAYVISIKSTYNYNGTSWVDITGASSAENINVNTGLFENIFNADDDNVQKALNKLDAKLPQYGPGIFITDVKPKNIGKNVSMIYNPSPNEEAVQKIITDDNFVLVTIEWDRGSQYRGAPFLEHIEITDFDIKDGSTYIKEDVEFNITALTELNVTYGDSKYSIEIEFEIPPVITDVTFGAYPGTQTSLKEDDVIGMTVDADTPFNKITLFDFELGKSEVFDVALNTSATVNITIANRGLTTATDQRVRVTVSSETGSTSNTFDSINTMLMNNSIPTLTVGSIDYPIGQGALKETEEATINFTSNKADVVTPVDLLGELTIGTLTANTLQVNRLSGGYNYNTNNVRFDLTFNENGATNSVSTVVRIADALPGLISTGWVQVRSGVGNVTINSSFNQMVKINDVSIPIDRGTLNSPTSVGTFSTIYSGLVSAIDSDIHNDNDVSMTIEIEGLAGRINTINRLYRIRGFAQKTLTLVYSDFIADIGTNVVSEANVIISGQILSDPPLDILTVKVADPSAFTEASQWCFIDLLTKVQVSNLVTNFGYEPGTNIEIKIEEI